MHLESVFKIEMRHYKVLLELLDYNFFPITGNIFLIIEGIVCSDYVLS